MIFVDTSVWIAFFRGSDAATVDAVRRLLDDDAVALSVLVRLELLGGVRAGELSRLRRLLDALPTYRPADTTWERAEEWAVTAAGKGQSFGVGDLLVAATAAEHDSQVWSLDGDFRRMEKLGLVTLHRPSG